MITKLPYTPSLQKVTQIKFGGLNHRKAASEGEIYDMRNISSDEYPIIAPRKKRKVLTTVPSEAICFTFGIDGTLYYIKDNKFCIANEDGDIEVGSTNCTELCRLSNNYIVLSNPGLAIYNTIDQTLLSESRGDQTLMTVNKLRGSTYVYDGSAISITIETGRIKIDFISSFSLQVDDFLSMIRLGRSAKINNCTVTSMSEGSPAYIYYDGSMSTGSVSSITAVVLDQYEDEYSTFSLSAQGTGHYEYYDRITLSASTTAITVTSHTSGDDNTVNGYATTGQTYAGKKISFGAYSATLASASSSTVGGRKVATFTFVAPVASSLGAINAFSIISPGQTVDFPAGLEHVFSCNNRLWGTEGNTIRASALGNPYEWNRFEGISTDSYAVDVGSAEHFTAGIAYDGKPRFFKPNTVTTVYGSYPAEYSTNESTILGVASGSERSAAVVGGYLYYLSEQGVCRWAGGAPTIISEALGAYLSNGVAGTDGRKYYISLLANGNSAMYVYDSAFNLWHKEDEFAAKKMETYERNLYALGRSFWRISGDTSDSAERFTSIIEFADMAEQMNEEKDLSQLSMRISVDEGTTMYVYICYDDNEWENVYYINPQTKRTIDIPIMPRRCDHFRIRIEADGNFKLYSMQHKYYGG